MMSEDPFFFVNHTDPEMDLVVGGVGEAVWPGIGGAWAVSALGAAGAWTGAIALDGAFGA